MPALPVHCMVVWQLAARLRFSKYCLNGWPRELKEHICTVRHSMRAHGSPAQGKGVQAGASALPPLSMGLHLPCTSKSKADLTANTALIQHVEITRRTGSGPTSSVPARSWHDTDITCFNSQYIHTIPPLFLQIHMFLLMVHPKHSSKEDAEWVLPWVSCSRDPYLVRQERKLDPSVLQSGWMGGAWK